MMAAALAGCETTQHAVTYEPQAELVYPSEKPRPQWSMQIGVEDVPGKLAFVGSAQKSSDEQAARREAEEDALKAFARYCGVDARFEEQMVTAQQTNDRGIIVSVRSGTDVSKLESEISTRGASIEKRYFEKYATKGARREPSTSYFNMWILLTVPQSEYRRIVQKKEEAEKEKEFRTVTEYEPLEGEEWFKQMGTLEDETYNYFWDKGSFAEGKQADARTVVENALKKQVRDFVGVSASAPGDFYANPGSEPDRAFTRIAYRVAGYKAPQKSFVEGELYLRARIEKTRVAFVRQELDKLRKVETAIDADIEVDREKVDRGNTALLRLDNGDEVRSGDYFKVVVKTNQSLFLYVINKDAKGGVNVLFPSPKISLTNPVPGNYQLKIPENVAYQFDANAGDEYFYVFLTKNQPARIEDITDYAQKDAGAPPAAGKFTREIIGSSEVMIWKLRLAHR